MFLFTLIPRQCLHFYSIAYCSFNSYCSPQTAITNLGTCSSLPFCFAWFDGGAMPSVALSCLTPVGKQRHQAIDDFSSGLFLCHLACQEGFYQCFSEWFAEFTASRWNCSTLIFQAEAWWLGPEKMQNYPLPSDTCDEFVNTCKLSKLKFQCVRSSLPILFTGKKEEDQFSLQKKKSRQVVSPLVYLVNHFNSSAEAFHQELTGLGS